MDDSTKKLFDNADKFIGLANELSQAENPGDIGAALRYAAARFSAFEASMAPGDFAAARDQHIKFFSDTFSEMLQANFAEYIEAMGEQKQG